jgi:hypothetical protein
MHGNGSLTCRKILQHGAFSFSSYLMEGVLQIIITLESLIALAKFEPMTLGSSGKHTNHYTTKVTVLHIRRASYDVRCKHGSRQICVVYMS